MQTTEVPAQIQHVLELPLEEAVVKAAEINHKMDNIISGPTPWDKSVYESEAHALFSETGENYLYVDYPDIPHIKVKKEG